MRFVMPIIRFGTPAVVLAALSACAPDYSPDTYSSVAVQQANKVDSGIVIGYREVKISDDGSVGVVTGGAAGGILGAEADNSTLPTALAALGGSVVGGLVGTAVQHTTGDTTGWEYIVREPKGDLVSVTQRQPTPIPIGQKVLVIEGKQARIVADYSSTAYAQPPAAPKSAAAIKPEPGATPPSAAASSAAVAVNPPPAAALAPGAPTQATPPMAPAVAPASLAPPPPSAPPAANPAIASGSVATQADPPPQPAPANTPPLAGPAQTLPPPAPTVTSSAASGAPPTPSP